VKQPVNVGESKIVHSGGIDGPGPVRENVLLLVYRDVARIGAGVGKNAGLRAGASIP
jgi:hypothetical protein